MRTGLQSAMAYCLDPNVLGALKKIVFDVLTDHGMLHRP